MTGSPTRPMATLFRFHDFHRKQKRIFFTRPELNQLLTLYSRQVMRGEWRDYAIDQHDGAALFSVFRHTHESPLYTIVKTAPGTGRHGDFAVMQGRHRLAGGATLLEALSPLQKSLGPVALRGEGERRV